MTVFCYFVCIYTYCTSSIEEFFGPVIYYSFKILTYSSYLNNLFAEKLWMNEKGLTRVLRAGGLCRRTLSA